MLACLAAGAGVGAIFSLLLSPLLDNYSQMRIILTPASSEWPPAGLRTFSAQGGTAMRQVTEQPCRSRPGRAVLWGVGGALLAVLAMVYAQGSNGKAADKPPPSSYVPVVINETFETIFKRMSAEKPKIMARQMALLHRRYDLDDRPAAGVKMSNGKKPLQGGVRVKLPAGMTWDKLAALTPEAIKDADAWPAGFYPLPHPNHAEGGMVFPKMEIDELKRQENRDLTRFDLDYDLPEHFLPVFPPPIFLTTRPDLGDVSKGKLVTIDNYYELFNGILNPKQLDGLRMLLSLFPQQQFNATEDRRSVRPSRGVACFDCHANGHTNAATHLVGDIRPQPFRHRLDTPSLRGVNIQRLFGSQRALRHGRGLHRVRAAGRLFRRRPGDGRQEGPEHPRTRQPGPRHGRVPGTARFPAVPKLDLYGKLDPKKASPSELKGQKLFFGKAQCSVCHPAPYYTDGTMHNLKVECFFKPKDINGRMASADGPIKTFTLRGIKDSPPYLHDGRCLTLEDSVEFFNLVLSLKLNAEEKK